MVECSECGMGVLPSDLPMSCSGCGCAKVYHYKCTSMTKPLAKLVTENVNVVFKCGQCLSSQCCGEQSVLFSNTQKIEEEMKKISSLSDSIGGIRDNIAAQINIALKDGMEQLGKKVQNALDNAVCGFRDLIGNELEKMKGSLLQFDASNKLVAMNVMQGSSRSTSESALNPRGKKRKVQEADDASDDVFNEKISFADVVKKKYTGNKSNGSNKDNTKSMTTNKVKVTRKARPVIVIKPKESNQSSDETRKFLTSKLDPKTHKISNFRNGKNGSIIAECATGYSINVVKDGIQSDLGENYNAVVPSSVPRLKVMGMSEKLSSDDFIQILKDQNEDIAINEVKVIRMYENSRFKYNKYNVVIEVDKDSHSCLLTA